ncbi:TetR/AcrR family transcriptional regulator [Acidimangrovimonas pyrenivorans]|uniref:TetR/AcrR family transcriptional regulator n=1 Tax=Acidimangrovimonas pyrenivorans TaxID=2030798 RepID=A0ABV7AG24_9RHOB
MQKRKSAEDRKAEIVAAVLRLADEIGPDRLTTNDVARAVGLSQPAIFRHFATKADLWIAVAERITEKLDAAWRAAMGSNGDPQSRLRALVQAQLQQIAAMPALPLILFSRELNIDNPQLRGAFHALLMRYQGYLVQVLSDWQAEGGLRRDLTPEDAATFLTSLVQGLALRWGLGARSMALVDEGMRLLDRQLAMFEADGH